MENETKNEITGGSQPEYLQPEPSEISERDLTEIAGGRGCADGTSEYCR